MEANGKALALNVEVQGLALRLEPRARECQQLLVRSGCMGFVKRMQRQTSQVFDRSPIHECRAVVCSHDRYRLTARIQFQHGQEPYPTVNRSDAKRHASGGIDVLLWSAHEDGQTSMPPSLGPALKLVKAVE